MDAVVLLMGCAAASYAFSLVGKYWEIKGHPRWLWMIMVLVGMVWGALPLILIKATVLRSSVSNIVIGSLALFYFALVLGRLAKKVHR